MWGKHKKDSGFTIVELLIVIVVIGILAAITIVAYNDIQNRARVSAVSAALNQSAKKIATWQVDTTTGSPTCTNFNELITGKTNEDCFFTSNGTTYQYKQINSGTGYCITATSGTTSYKLESTNTSPISGACAGHGKDGAEAITNLATNPSFEVYPISNSNGAASVTNPTVGDAVNGTRVSRVTRNDSGSSGGWWDAAVSIPQNTVLTACLSVRGTDSPARDIRIEWINLAGSAIISNNTIANTGTINSSWKRLCGSATSPTGAGRLRLTLYGSGGAINNYFDIDAVMITTGPSSYAYADGNTSNWIWNGGVNGSTSTGSPL